MFLFKGVNSIKLYKASLIYLAALGLSACAGLQKDMTVSTELEKAKAGDGSQSMTDGGSGIKKVAIPDPMKKDLPLDLIKGYDQVNQSVKNNDRAGAITRLQQLQLKFPQSSGPSYRTARIYRQQKDYANALKAVDASLAINANNYYAHNLRGVILREQGEFVQAKQAYVDAVAVYPAHPESHLNLAILADIYLYDLPLALSHYEQYLALITETDKKVSGWVIDLKRRLPKSQ